MKTQKEHWEDVYKTKSADAVSWFQAHAIQSMQLIKSVRAPSSAQIIDVGGGASTLVDDLLDAGFKNVSVLDLSAEALNLTQTRLGARGHSVEWIAGDIRYVELEDHRYDIWHDRAVFHFLTDPVNRMAYVQQVMKSVKLGGHVIVATFAPDGPEQCS